MDNNSNLLYMQVKQEIKNKLLTLKTNERLPSRNELIKEYNVTRTTVDRAISELIGEGYLYTKDGSGTYKKEDPDLDPISLGSSSVDSWGVILPDIMHNTYPGILRGVEDVASKSGINVVICNTDNLIEKENKYIYKLIDSKVRGVIIIPGIIGEGSNCEAYNRLKEMDIPFVLCNRGATGVEAPMVLSNNFYGALLATQHLLSQGYRNIAYISRPMYSTSLDRYQGYITALSQKGIPVRGDYVIFEKTFEEEKPGYESARALLRTHPELDAVFCFNDEVAQGVYKAMEEGGRRVGMDTGIVGYDDTDICEAFPAKLSSVKFKTYEIGSIAARILLKIRHGEAVPPNKIVILQPELEIRDSSRRSL